MDHDRGGGSPPPAKRGRPTQSKKISVQILTKAFGSTNVKRHLNAIYAQATAQAFPGGTSSPDVQALAKRMMLAMMASEIDQPDCLERTLDKMARLSSIDRTELRTWILPLWHEIAGDPEPEPEPNPSAPLATEAETYHDVAPAHQGASPAPEHS